MTKRYSYKYHLTANLTTMPSRNRGKCGAPGKRNPLFIRVTDSTGLTSIYGIIIVKPSGFVDDISTCLFHDALTRIYRQGHPTMVIDLSRVCYLVSSSLDLIISTSRQLDYKGGKLCLYCALGGVKTVLKAAQIDTQIDVYCTREEAVAACLG